MIAKKSERKCISKCKKDISKDEVLVKLKNKLHKFETEKEFHNHMQMILLHYRCILNEVSHKMRLIKHIRSMYLIINRHRQILYSTYNKSFWITAKKNKYKFIGNIDNFLNNDNYSLSDKRYLRLTKRTLLKYDDNYGSKLGKIMNTKFGEDISWVISTFI